METRFVNRIYYFEEVDSTNNVARRLADRGIGERVVVIADHQTHGRGRIGRDWFSPHGGIWLSIVLKPKIAPSHATIIALLAASVLANTIKKRWHELNVKTKWPNDILIDGKKVAGILTEMEIKDNMVDYIIVGMGINANVDISIFPENIRKLSTSLKEEIGREINRVKFIQDLFREFDRQYNIFMKYGSSVILAEWKIFSETIGRHVQIATDKRLVKGEAIDIDDCGALILKLEDNSFKKIVSGECIHTYPMIG
ncbi:MAG: Putative biotin ligase [Candidatus Methanolliviera sp. GoM_asphalt]|nr:MAG: Putative biotin ligase [Candidatus Methanolliviera sp. GoM_asphalt]